MKRLCLLAFAAAVGCGGSTPAEKPAEQPTESAVTPPAEPASSCPVDGLEEVAIQLPTSTGESLLVNGLDHDRIWNNDLNGDGMPDMILQQRGGCNADDECIVTVWLGCTPGSFQAIWGPDFAYELYVLEESHDYNGTTWMTLELAMNAGDDGMERTTLKFDGTKYSPAP